MWAIYLYELVTILHMLPAPILSALGRVSDIVSDSSPEFIRSVEHVIFTILLN